MAAQDRRNEERREVWRSFLARRRPRVIPLIVDCELPFWAANFGVDLTDCFTSPERYVESMLAVKLLHWETFGDDTVVEPRLQVTFHTGFEPSLFGSDMVLRPDDCPIPGPPVVRDWADVSRLDYPDFRTNPAMRHLHAFYEEVEAIVGDELVVEFPQWLRGPWGLARSLRGFSNLMLDLHDSPAVVHQLQHFLATAQIRWGKDRARFLEGRFGSTSQSRAAAADRLGGADRGYLGARGAMLAHDEVDGAMLSRHHYQEFIFPYEAQVSAALPGLYYHSCGNLVPLLADVARLPNLRTLHVSARTDLESTVRLLGDRFLYQKCLNPIDEVILPGPEEVERIIHRLVDVSCGVHFQTCADGIGAVEGALSKATAWLLNAREVVNRRATASTA